jgi:UDP-glucose 4-epimerase
LKKQLLWDACNKLIHNTETVEFYGTGTETRDWLHVSDAADLISKISQFSEKYLILNGGFGKRTTIKSILTVLANLLKSNQTLRFNNINREGDPKHYWADIAAANNFGWQPKIQIESGLEEYVSWFKKQR